MPYVFVYGTLRAGEANDIAVAASRSGIAAPKLIGTTTVAGRLFDFGNYPGMVVGEQASQVVGDVYEVDEALVAVLDEIEEVYPGVDGLFMRQQVSVDVQGSRLPCLFYPVAYASVKGRPEIRSGDWVAYRLAR